MMSTTSTLYALAWSEDDGGDDELPHRRSWLTTVLLCLAIAAVVGAVWLWAAIFISARSASLLPPIQSRTSALAMPTVVVVTVPEARTSLPDQIVTQQPQTTVQQRIPSTVDANFLALIRADGMQPNGDGSDLINQAHVVCSYHAKGFDAGQIVAGTHPDDPEVSLAQETFFVHLSINTYCP